MFKTSFVAALSIAVLSVALAVPASAAIINCGTAAVPTACSATVNGVNLTFDTLSVVSNLSGLGGGTRITASQIDLNLITTATTATLQFTPDGMANWGPFTGTQLEQLAVDYRVTPVNASVTGTGVTGISSNFTDLFTGPGGAGQNGAGSETKDVCRIATCSTTGTLVSSVNLNDQTGTPGVQGTYSGFVSPPFAQQSGSFYVRDTVQFQANNNSVEGSMFGNTYYTGTPEPASYALFGGGLIAVAMLRRRKKGVKSS